MLTTLQIKNFKCWRDTGEMRMAPITGLFGANSSGKSSILQFLLMLKQTVELRNSLRALNLGGREQDYVSLGAFDEIVYAGAGSKLEIEFAFEWTLRHRLLWSLETDTPYERKLLADDMSFRANIDEFREGLQGSYHLSHIGVENFTYGIGKTDQSEFSEIQMFRNSDEETYSIVASKTPESSEKRILFPSVKTPPDKFYGIPAKLRHDIFQQYPDIMYLQQMLENQFDDIYYLGPLRAYPRREYIWSGSFPNDVGREGQDTIAALLYSRVRGNDQTTDTEIINDRTDVEKKVAFWLQKLGVIHSFRLETNTENAASYSIRVQQNPESPFVYLTDVGFGVSQILPVLTLCYYVPEGSTILFEQPEIHLHPKIQAGLADVFIDVAKKRNIQIIFESHSEHLLTRLQLRMAQEDLREEGIDSEKVALYFCERKGKEAHLLPLQIDEFGDITNWPEDFFGNELNERIQMMEAAVERKQGEKAA